MSIDKPKFPTEVVELPSKGLLYPEDNPLSSGKVEIKYMTAREEDILTNTSYITDGTVLDNIILKTICGQNDIWVTENVHRYDKVLLLARDNIRDTLISLENAREFGYINEYILLIFLFISLFPLRGMHMRSLNSKGSIAY